MSQDGETEQQETGIYKFDEFNELLNLDIVGRKNEEEESFNDVRNRIIRLERCIHTEIRRRVETTKGLQVLTENMANIMLEGLQKQILQRIAKIAEDLENLDYRCERLSANIRESKRTIPLKLQENTQYLERAISDLKLILRSQDSSFQERELQINRMIDTMKRTIETKLEKESANSKEHLGDLCQLIDTKMTNIQQSDFHEFITTEIDGLKEALQTASATREKSDDEIVQALNQYTSALQKSLRIAATV